MTKCYARVLTGWLFLVPFYNFRKPQCLAYMVSTEGTPKENPIYLTIDNLAQARSGCGHPSRYKQGNSGSLLLQLPNAQVGYSFQVDVVCSLLPLTFLKASLCISRTRENFHFSSFEREDC